MLLSGLMYSQNTRNCRMKIRPRKWIFNLLGCPRDDCVALGRTNTRVPCIPSRGEAPRAKHKRLSEIVREARALRPIQNTLSSNTRCLVETSRHYAVRHRNLKRKGKASTRGRKSWRREKDAPRARRIDGIPRCKRALKAFVT